MPNQNGLSTKPPPATDARVDGPNSGPNALRVQSYTGPQLYKFVQDTRKELKYINNDGEEIIPLESPTVKKMIAFCFHNHQQFLKFCNIK